MDTERVSVGCATCGATDLPIIGHADVCPGAPERGCDRCGDHVEDGSGHYVGQYRVCSECNESAWAAFMRARASVAAGSGVSVELIERGSEEEWPTFALAWIDEDGRAWQATVQAASESAARQAWIDGDIIGSRRAEPVRRPVMFRVLWDNGHASGVLPMQFATREAAEAFGDDWLLGMSAADPDAVDGDYQFEVIEDDPAESFELGEGDRELRDPYNGSVTAWVGVGADGILLRPVGTHSDSSNIIIEVHDGGEVRMYCGGDAETVHCFDLATGKYLGVES